MKRKSPLPKPKLGASSAMQSRGGLGRAAIDEHRLSAGGSMFTVELANVMFCLFDAGPK